MTKKFFKTLFTVEVLSEDEPVTNLGLEDIARAIYEGDCSGVTQLSSVQELTPKEMAVALKTQGSDPGFFGLTDGGKLIQ